MMPVLAVLAVVIALFVVCRPEAIEGLKFYLLPDFSKFSVMTVLGAMGQLFYSMSLAMGIMITYGSYMKKKESIESCVKQIEVFDFGIAFIAGLMVIPAVFAFGDGNVKAGPGLMFEVLPRVFNNMSLGSVVGAAFFILVLMAALTSSISLMETIVSVLQERLRWNRVVSCIVTTLFAIAVGIPSSFGFGVWSNVTPLNMSILDFFDFASNSVIMPIVALLTCIFIGHVTGTKLVSDEVESSGTFKRKKMFEVLIRYVAPVIIILILLSSVANGLGWIVI